ncbi:DNA-binding transcriptional LysR family regulator [Sphaerotilus hippei]|uniref:DNA-binding transcriptional LysR family regulator n=1 Tax=Sphaerotilus hippei TaxID=744406 RepID=A0A318GYX9_9BURK|nr:LysR family transcriptional regulator [Sphaerotilus hippei]PXW95191.1 DNA-binding transcriptional LysR family regulator [Sphaerotilus hippei]
MAINEFRTISVFITAAELGSLRKTAAALNISPQAASQALAQLEQHLNVRLFHRTTRSMALTDEGRQFLDEAQPSLLGLRRALLSARQAKDEIAGPLRIVGPRSTFQGLLWRLIDEFCERHPGVVPDVQLEDRVGNWVEDRVDVGFRLGLSPHEGVIARRLFPVQLVLCASPDYLRRHGVPDSMAALPAHRCSVYRNPGTGRVVPWRFKVGDEEVEQPVVPALCTNDEILELHAVLAGRVIGQLAGVTAAPHLRAGRLVPLLVDHMPDRYSYFVYYGSRSAQPVRVRAFIDLVVARLAGNGEHVLDMHEMEAAARGARALSG